MRGVARNGHDVWGTPAVCAVWVILKGRRRGHSGPGVQAGGGGLAVFKLMMVAGELFGG